MVIKGETDQKLVIMGRKTTLTKASKNVPTSLRTTVPNAYVEYLDVKESDELNWETGERDGKRFLIVTKAED
jgi:hypothetical protein